MWKFRGIVPELMTVKTLDVGQVFLAPFTLGLISLFFFPFLTNAKYSSLSLEKVLYLVFYLIDRKSVV